MRYEDAAKRVTVEGWACVECGRFCGDGKSGENAARYCHGSADMPCKTEGCAGRCERHRTVCGACAKVMKDAKWAALPKVPYDGSPVVEWDGDRFYWDDGELADAIEERLEEGGSIESFRLVVAEPSKPRAGFSMEDYLCDDLPDDDYDSPKFEEIDKIVNDWIRANGPTTYHATGQAVAVESLPVPTPEVER